MSDAPRPYTLVAELTYACPLRCTYCSNPVDHDLQRGSLDTATWLRVLGEAEALGVVQVHFTGGEPLLRRDLEALVAGARALDLYTNLVTSGVPLDRARLEDLRAAGLDHLQLSLQGADEAGADEVAGVPVAARKREVAAWAKEAGLSLTVNVVIHRGNVGDTEAVIALAERLGADRLELASAQYLGWALVNRAALLPTRAQIEAVRAAARAARERLRGRMDVVSVLPDYHADLPRSCMDGWGRRYLVVSPGGLVLPCHAAHTIPGLAFDDVRAAPLAAIWSSSPALAAFRGEGWMPAPCRACDRRAIDFGGCRCQAHHLTGDAAAVDPACRLSPHHGLVEAARAEAEGSAQPAPIHRRSLMRGPRATRPPACRT
jgi:pyrroloquinoline quinone biosynthesis protein E